MKQDTPSVRINRADYNRLKALKKKTNVPIVGLISYAVAILENEYKAK